MAGSDELRSPAEQQLVIYADGGAPELAWHLVLYTQRPVADWHVMVSARTGNVLASWDAILHDSGSGQTYDPNAVQQTGTTTLVDNADANSVALQNARVNLTLSNLTTGVQTLKGSYVDTTAPGVTGCNLPYTPGTAMSPTRTYDYTRDDDRFEEVLAYAAIDGTQSWIQSLGFTNANNRPVPIDVHCISDDNSYYSSSDAALHMGDGGVDDGEDADVIIHEYGHSMHDNQVPGWGPAIDTEQRAMGEGFGDFLAGMAYVEKGNATYMSSYKYCVGEWDAVSYNPVTGPTDGSGCLRWINGVDEGSGSDIGAYLGVPVEEHDDGRYWAAALTCVYEGKGADSQARDDIMQIVIASHFSLTPDLTTNAFEDAVDALLDADQTYLDGVNWSLIGDCALERGLIASRPPLPPCASAPFTDVGTSHPFCKEIKWMRDTSISAGFGDGTYKPSIDVTRQAMAAFMARLDNAVLTPCMVPPFPDVPIEHPFCPEIKWMKVNNISTGFGDGTYGPGMDVTRQAMSRFMARLAGATLTPCVLERFPDVPITHPFCQEIKWMRDNNISTGFGDGTYRPGIDVTRQAMSAFMFRVSDILD
ncbi:MAG: S-layer homology domain-containing protein [Candidatus Limnocylindrales bacterium]